MGKVILQDSLPQLAFTPAFLELCSYGPPDEDHEIRHEGHEVHESFQSDEGDEGNEEVHRCQGQEGQELRVPWHQGKTSGGLTKDKLTKNKTGKVVSKKASAHGKKAYKNISGWTKAVQTARKELGIKGFCAVGGKGAQGKALYAKAKSIYSA